MKGINGAIIDSYVYIQISRRGFNLPLQGEKAICSFVDLFHSVKI